MTDYKKVRYYLRDFYIDYAHLVYTLYPLVDFDGMKTITSDIESAFLASTEIARDSKGVCYIKCKFESSSEFLEFNRYIHVEYVGRVFSDFENPRKYIEFQVPTPSEISEADILYERTMENYYARIAATKQMLNDRYGIVNAKINYYPGYTYKPRRESQPKYFAVSSEGYKPIGPIKEVDTSWIDDIWKNCVKHYTNEPLSAGVAIIKEEDNMAGYHYGSINRQNYKTIKETRKDTDIIPKIIRNVQFNEKKGVVTVIWVDGTVTMAKCGPNDIWDPEKGLSIAIMKRFFKSTTSMNKWIKETVPEEEPVEPAKSDDPKESFF